MYDMLHFWDKWVVANVRTVNIFHPSHSPASHIERDDYKYITSLVSGLNTHHSSLITGLSSLVSHHLSLTTRHSSLVLRSHRTWRAVCPWLSWRRPSRPRGSRRSSWCRPRTSPGGGGQEEDWPSKCDQVHQLKCWHFFGTLENILLWTFTFSSKVQLLSRIHNLCYWVLLYFTWLYFYLGKL